MVGYIRLLIAAFSVSWPLSGMVTQAIVSLHGEYYSCIRQMLIVDDILSAISNSDDRRQAAITLRSSVVSLRDAHGKRGVDMKNIDVIVGSNIILRGLFTFEVPEGKAEYPRNICAHFNEDTCNAVLFQLDAIISKRFQLTAKLTATATKSNLDERALVVQCALELDERLKSASLLTTKAQRVFEEYVKQRKLRNIEIRIQSVDFVQSLRANFDVLATTEVCPAEH